MRLEVDKKQKALEYFAYAHDWIARHQDCDTCDKNEWKGVAAHLSNAIQFYLKNESIEGVPSCPKN